MRYVFDSSVAFKTVCPEIDSDKAEAILRDAQNAILDLIAPDIFSYELAHAIRERRGKDAFR